MRDWYPTFRQYAKVGLRPTRLQFNRLVKLNAFTIYLQTQDDILSQENKAKARARYKTIPKRRPLYATATRPIPKRRRPLYATATRPILKRRRPLYATATRPIPKRRRPLYATATRPIPKRRRPLGLYATATTQILNLSNLLKSSDIKRTSRRTALLKGRNTRTIQLPLGHLKGIGIGMTPLSDWLNVLPRGRGSAGVTELPLPPKGMSWHVVLH